MVKIKKMNESLFAKHLKSLNVAGELVRSRQEEKEGLLDEFDQTCKRFFFGKISERTLASSVKKTNKELTRLDKEIRMNISNARKAADNAAKLTAKQKPIGYRATLSGISGGEGSKKTKRKTKKKTSKARKSPTRRAKPKTKSRKKSGAKKKSSKKKTSKRKK